MDDYQDLSENQRQILSLIVDELQTPKDIANRREKSIQAIYKAINKLKKKGYLKGRFDRGVEKVEAPYTRSPTTQTHLTPYISTGTHQIRLHGQEWKANIVYADQLYHRLLKDNRTIKIDSHTIRLSKRSIEIYCNPNQSFFADTAEVAHTQSLAFWQPFFNRVEERLGIIIIKGNKAPIEVQSHYAETNNELARTEKHIRITAKEDNKSWLIADFSHNIPEIETIHPKTAQRDMGEILHPFFNDMREYKAKTGETLLLSDIAKIQSQTNENLNLYAENIKSHIAAIKQLGDSVQELTTIVKELKKG